MTIENQIFKEKEVKIDKLTIIINNTSIINNTTISSNNDNKRSSTPFGRGADTDQLGST